MKAAAQHFRARGFRLTVGVDGDDGVYLWRGRSLIAAVRRLNVTEADILDHFLERIEKPPAGAGGDRR